MGEEKKTLWVIIGRYWDGKSGVRTRTVVIENKPNRIEN